MPVILKKKSDTQLDLLSKAFKSAREERPGHRSSVIVHGKTQKNIECMQCAGCKKEVLLVTALRDWHSFGNLYVGGLWFGGAYACTKKCLSKFLAKLSELVLLKSEDINAGMPPKIVHRPMVKR